MLITSLVMTSVLLAGVWMFARSQSGLTGAQWFALFCLVGQFFCAFGGFASAVFALNSLLVWIAAVWCQFRSASTRSLVKSTLVVTAVSYAVCGLFAIESVQTHAELRREFPMESLAPRLDYEQKYVEASAGEVLSTQRQTMEPTVQQASQERLVEMEGALGNPRFNFRNRMLKQLHEGAVADFINSPSFGVARMLRASPRYLKADDDPPVALPSPEPAADRALSADDSAGEQEPDIEPEKLHTLRDDTWQMHVNSLRSFANQDGWGYVVDREHVAGFQSHRLGSKPEPGWDISLQLVRLELVSLMKFETPRVYVSEYLPRMDELDEARTRELDRFESQALESLLGGEDIVDEPKRNRLRMLGSLRALTQCIECHEVERGTLLGAFSYEFRRTPPLPRQEEPPTDTGPRT